MRSAIMFAVASCALFAVVGTSDANEWRWHKVAWDGFSVASVVSPPESSDVVYASLKNRWPLDDEGVYKSYDSGLTWRYLSESYNPRSGMLTIDPKDFATVYCGTGVVNVPQPEEYPKRTRDAGEHWDVLPLLVDRMVPSPWTDGLILATGHINGGWSLWKSTDDGETWTGLSGAETPGMTDNVIFHREDSLLVFAGYYPFSSAPHGLARSSDEGETWEVVLDGTICAFDQDPANSSHWIAMKAYHPEYS